MGMVVASMVGVAASAQTGAAGQPPASGSATGQATASQSSTPQQGPVPMAVETRPGTTTFMGDTGLWFVPTGDVLPAGRWSVSGYRVNFDFTQGFTDVSNWPVT